MRIIKLLLIDDEEEFCATLAERLSLRSFDVTFTRSGSSGLELLQKATTQEFPDVLILDMLMPDMDGLATLRAVRRAYPTLPVVMLTGHASTEDGLRAMQQGASDYLLKPVDIGTLIEKIMRVLPDSI